MIQVGTKVRVVIHGQGAHSIPRHYENLEGEVIMRRDDDGSGMPTVFVDLGGETAGFYPDNLIIVSRTKLQELEDKFNQWVAKLEDPATPEKTRTFIRKKLDLIQSDYNLEEERLIREAERGEVEA